MLLKWQLKKLGFQRLRDLLRRKCLEYFWHEEGIVWNTLSDYYKIRQKKEKSVGRISEKLEMTSK